jgi:hypothetical protein
MARRCIGGLRNLHLAPRGHRASSRLSQSNLGGRPDDRGIRP